MDLPPRKTIEWTHAGRPFKLVCIGDTCILSTPDGRITTLSRDEWKAVSEVLVDALGPVAIEAQRAAGGAGAATAPNAGKPWSAEDDAALTGAWRTNATVPTLAERFGRTRVSIAARLVKLGLVAARAEAEAEARRGETKR